MCLSRVGERIRHAPGAACAGDDAAGPTSASTIAPEQPPAPAAEPFSARVAQRVFGGFVSAYAEGRFEDAAELWATGLREQPGSVCRTVGDLAAVLRQSAADGPAWPSFEIRRVLRVRLRPAPQAVFEIVPLGGPARRSRLAVGFSDDAGRWRLAEPYPIEAGNRCIPPGPTRG